MAGFTLVQQSTTIDITASPAPVTLPAATTAGNLIIVKIALSATVTPTLSNGFLLATSHTQATGPQGVWIFYLANAASLPASNISTITYSSGGLTAIAEEWAPPAGTIALDRTGFNTTISGTSLSVSTSATITANDELATAIHWAQYTAATTATVTPGSGFTLDTGGPNQQGGSFKHHIVFSYKGDTGASSSGTTITDAATIGTTPTTAVSSLIATFAATGTSANVTGVPAATTVAAPAGTVEGDARTGILMPVFTVAGIPGIPSGETSSSGGGGNVVGATPALVTVADVSGTVAGGANVTGTHSPFEIAAQAGIGRTSADGNATGIKASLVVAGKAGTPSGVGTPTPNGPSGNWTLLLNDDFLGTTLDTSVWTVLTNRQMNQVNLIAGNVSVSGSNLHLTLSNLTTGGAIRGSPTEAAGSGPAVLAVGHCVEAKINFPGTGTNTVCYNWPAFWATDQSAWPACGECDIAEVQGWGPNSGGAVAATYITTNVNNVGSAVPGLFGNVYHTFTWVRQSSNALVYYDGVLVRNIPTSDNGLTVPLILNNGCSSTAVNNHAPATMLVDYVRVWAPA